MTAGIGGTVVAQSHYRIIIKLEEKMMKDKDRMKILIAYDGSECAESSIDDLKRAGLPRRAEAVVLTIAEELIPAPTSIGGVATTFGKAFWRKRRIHWRWPGGRSREYKQLFPGWKILAEAGIGSPGREIIARADEWLPDLIVVGSHMAARRWASCFSAASRRR